MSGTRWFREIVARVLLDFIVPHLHRVQHGQAPAREGQVLPHPIVPPVDHVRFFNHNGAPRKGCIVALCVPAEGIHPVGLSKTIVKLQSLQHLGRLGGGRRAGVLLRLVLLRDRRFLGDWFGGWLGSPGGLALSAL